MLCCLPPAIMFPLPQRQWWWKWESLPESDVRRASKRGTQVG